MISVHSCVRGRMSVHLPEDWFEGWWFLGHSCVRGWRSVHLLEGWLFRCIHLWGVRFWCIYLRDDDFGAFMFEGRILVNKMFVHLPEEWRFAVHSCVRGKIPVHFLEGWWFRCIHVWGVGYRCIYLRSDDLRCIHVWGVGYRCIYLRDDDFGAFMCEG